MAANRQTDRETDRQTDIHMHVCNAVTLVWGSLRLAPTSSYLIFCGAIMVTCNYVLLSVICTLQ